MDVATFKNVLMTCPSPSIGNPIRYTSEHDKSPPSPPRIIYDVAEGHPSHSFSTLSSYYSASFPRSSCHGIQSLYNPSVARNVLPFVHHALEDVKGPAPEDLQARDEFYFTLSSSRELDPTTQHQHMPFPVPPAPSQVVQAPSTSPVEPFILKIIDLGLSLDFPQPPSPPSYDPLRTPIAIERPPGERSRSPSPTLSISSSPSSSPSSSSHLKDGSTSSFPSTPSSCNVNFVVPRSQSLTTDDGGYSEDGFELPDTFLCSEEVDAKPSDALSEITDLEDQEDSEDVADWYSRELGHFITQSSPPLHTAKRDSVRIIPDACPSYVPPSSSPPSYHPTQNPSRQTNSHSSMSPQAVRLLPAPPSPPLPSARVKRAKYSGRPVPKEAVPVDVDLHSVNTDVSVDAGMEREDVEARHPGYRGNSREMHAGKETGPDSRKDALKGYRGLRIIVPEEILYGSPNPPLAIPAPPLDLEMIIGTRWQELVQAREYSTVAKPESPIEAMYTSPDDRPFSFSSSATAAPAAPPPKPSTHRAPRSRWSISNLSSLLEDKKDPPPSSSHAAPPRQPLSNISLYRQPIQALKSKWSSSALLPQESRRDKQEKEGLTSRRSLRLTFARQKKAKHGDASALFSGTESPS